MAFEISPDIATERLSLQITQNGSDAVVQIPLGFDVELARNYSLTVCMAPFMGAVQGELELTFFVAVYNERDEEFLEPVWCGMQTREFVRDEAHLDHIRTALLTAIDALIAKLSPRHVRMCTLQANLPNKALRKFNMIATLFRQKGYRSGKGDAYHGRHIWMIEKQ